MTTPLVSVIIPVYNRERWIRESVSSAQNQTFDNIEIIVMDDGSTDRTAETVKELAGKDTRIHYHFQSNLGPASARNAAIQASRGDCIAVLDSDDLWQPEKLAAQMETVSSHPEVDFIYCAGTVIDEDANVNHKKTQELRPVKLYTAESILFEQVRIFTSGVLFRRRCLEKSGMFDESMKFFEDVDLWFRILLFHQGCFIDRDLIQKRDHPESYASTSSRHPEVDLYQSVLNFLAKACDLFEKHVRRLTERERSLIFDRYRVMLIKESLAAGCRREARREALLHLKQHKLAGAFYCIVSLIPGSLVPSIIATRRKLSLIAISF